MLTNVDIFWQFWQFGHFGQICSKLSKLSKFVQIYPIGPVWFRPTYRLCNRKPNKSNISCIASVLTPYWLPYWLCIGSPLAPYWLPIGSRLSSPALPTALRTATPPLSLARRSLSLSFWLTTSQWIWQMSRFSAFWQNLCVCIYIYIYIYRDGREPNRNINFSMFSKNE